MYSFLLSTDIQNVTSENISGYDMFSKIVLPVLTKDNITLVIAIVGFIISIYNLILSIVTQRKSLEITILDIYSLHDIIAINISIENRSRLPIAITNFTLVSNDSYRTNCTPIPTLLFENVRRIGKEVVERKQTYSTQLPISISSLAAANAIVIFEKVQEPLPVDSTQVTVLVGTNRGKAVQMKLSLPQEQRVHKKW